MELDIKKGSHHDLSIDVGPYIALIRAALENKLNAIVGGPNCRSRSVLRNYKVPGQPGIVQGQSDLGKEENMESMDLQKLKKL